MRLSASSPFHPVRHDQPGHAVERALGAPVEIEPLCKPDLRYQSGTTRDDLTNTITLINALDPRPPSSNRTHGVMSSCGKRGYFPVFA
jgi:hypothetical protein